MQHPFKIYTEQVLSYHLSGQEQEKCKDLPSSSEDTAQKHLHFVSRRYARAIILFGAGDGALSTALAKNKPDEMELIVCDLYPEHARKINEQHSSPAPNSYTMLADSSIWALLLLLIQNGYSAAESHLILNPVLDGKSKNKHQNLQKLFSGTQKVSAPAQHSACKISAAAILSPDEPNLENFIKNFPEWINEIVLVWDCEESESIPQLNKFHRAEIINIQHPLEDDFSAQRNRMLKNCSGEWIIYLDADERLTSESWEKMRLMTAFEGCSGWYLPRMTFYPDQDHCRIGYGLWPDLQLRFFKNTPNLKFINKIHEQIVGMEGSSGILTHCPIQHLTHLLKSREKIESKLENFNNSTGDRFSHRLGEDYPHIPNELLTPRQGLKLDGLLLPVINMA